MRHTRSECAACGMIFAGVRAFDAHRVGSYQSKTRRCLTISEMQAQGMTQEARGWWMLPEASTGPSVASRQSA
ncbi:MAG TPA: hypothetical protein VN729_08005 [Ktedonobacteraceae bacterium]|nr:hypothetical protein [Ktedonobacteraceae bacterium]